MGELGEALTEAAHSQPFGRSEAAVHLGQPLAISPCFTAFGRACKQRTRVLSSDQTGRRVVCARVAKLRQPGRSERMEMVSTAINY
jgi:hypothetical protein